MKTIEADQTTDFDMPLKQSQDVAVHGEGNALPTPPQAPAMPSTVNIGALLTAMLDKACDPNLDKDKFLALKDTVKEFAAAEAERAFNWDMSLAQAEMQPVVRRLEVKLERADGSNAGQSYKVADALDIDEMIRPIYTKYGFSVTHNRRVREADGGGFVVISTLRHRAGHSITAEFSLTLDTGPGRSNVKSAGSTDTYGRKYNVLGLFNIVRKNEDTDGAISGGAEPISFDEAAEIKKLVDEAGIGDGLEGNERKNAIIEWFNDRLGYPLPKGYVSIRQEDRVRICRTLLSMKAARLTSKESGLKL